MRTHTRRFFNVDEYERWLDKNGEQIHVVSIRNSADSRHPHVSLNKPSVTVQYRTNDKSLAPRLKQVQFGMVSLAAIAAVFLLVFVYTFAKVNEVARVAPLKLDAHYHVVH